MGYLEQQVVVHQVGQTGHVLSQSVDEFVQRADDEAALRDVETSQVFVQLLVELIGVLAQSGNLTTVIATRLVAEDHATKGAIGQLVLVELARRVRIRRDGKAGSDNRIARHTVGRGTQGTSPVAIVHVAQQHRHLLVTTTETVGHLHLGQVEVLRESTLCFERQRVLDERCVGRIRRRETKEYLRAGRLFLVVRLGLFPLLPFQQFVFFGLVVLTEITANGVCKILELALVIARMSHQIGHHARRFLPTVVGVLKFRAADMCAKYGEKHRNHGFLHVY